MERKRRGTPQINNPSTDSSLSQPPLSSSVSFPTIVVTGRSSPIIVTYFHMATTYPPKLATHRHAYRSSPGSQKSRGTPGRRDRGKRRSTAQRGYTPWRGGAAGLASRVCRGSRKPYHCHQFLGLSQVLGGSTDSSPEHSPSLDHTSPLSSFSAAEL